MIVTDFWVNIPPIKYGTGNLFNLHLVDLIDVLPRNENTIAYFRKLKRFHCKLDPENHSGNLLKVEQEKKFGWKVDAKWLQAISEELYERREIRAVR
ncbi:hypothetical protein G9A89_021111 [Geosiphon pyriformis]|nr:hypothetical protein G9A89_021111 [Geosiphon pyriformis]